MNVHDPNQEMTPRGPEPRWGRIVRACARVWQDETSHVGAVAAETIPVSEPKAETQPDLLAGAPVSDTDVEELAFWLATTWSQWIHRRVETFVFIDAVTVRRQISVDFTLPTDVGITGPQVIPIPLMTLVKADMRHFSVVDEVGRSLPILSTPQDSAIAARGLMSLIKGLEGGPADLSKAQEQAIESIVGALDPDAGRDAVKSGLKPDGVLTAALAGLGKHDREDITAQLDLFASSFLLVAVLPLRAGQRRILKLGYDAEIRASGKGRSFWRKSYFWLNRGLSSFGVVGRVEAFEDLLVDLSASYHAEVVVPQDTYAVETSLEIDGSLEDPVVDKHRYRPHVHVSGRKAGERATLAVLLRAQREPLVAPLLVTAVIIAATLWFTPAEAAKGRLDGASLAALLLVPFALAAFYVRSAENTYVTEMLRGVRVAAMLPILSGVCVIATLGLGFLKLGGHQVERTPLAFEAVHVARWAAAIPAAYLLLVFLIPLLSRPLRRFLRSAQQRRRDRARAKEARKRTVAKDQDPAAVTTR